MKSDLHLHTTASDGKLEPRQLVALAVHNGLDVIAITDHDTVDGVAPALAAAEPLHSLTVIPGVELSTDVSQGEVHVLGYFIDYTDKDFITKLRWIRNKREERAKKMIAKLGELGMELQWQRILELAKDGSIGRPHVAWALLEKGYVTSFKEAFDKYIGRNGPAYAERQKMTPTEAVSLITDVRGLPVLAHPADISNLDELLEELIEAGLVGMEVYYNGYTPDVIGKLTEIAESNGLVTTGGTDYHAFGDRLESKIGEMMAPPESINKLFEMADKRNLELMRHFSQA